LQADVRVAGEERHLLDEGWEASSAEPDAAPDDWIPARVPGTAARALQGVGRWRPGDGTDFDALDWWFRTRFTAPAAEPGEEVVLRLGGLATVAEVFLNGERLLGTESMFVEHEVDVGSRLRGSNELAVRCRALGPLLRISGRPRARWRPRLADGHLRFFRTTLLGRAPGFAPGPAPVGPWRPIVLLRRRGIAVDDLALRPRLDGRNGVVGVRMHVRTLAGAPLRTVEIDVGGHTATLPVEGGAVRGDVHLPGVARWWPHTHGEPVLHDVRAHVAGLDVEAGRIGFRMLEPGRAYDVEREPLSLAINGVNVFARGAVWTPLEPIGLAPSEDELRAALVQARDAGMNMLRVVGTMVYESRSFHDLCDELGILVWQDFMFANFDYPIDDPAFRALVEREARQALGRVAGRPSLAVLCGNSEVEQQVTMLGLDPALGRGEVFGELLPRWAREEEADAVYVPSAPSGGDPPIRPDRGVAHYFGVGGYRRPLEDARRARPGFAAECLALSNVPDRPVREPAALATAGLDDPSWKAGIPRDVGADWDFEDVRDHYLQLLFGVDAAELRRTDSDRYLELGRAVSGEVMAEVFGEWRRAGSPCSGGLVLWLRDVLPGAGWGVVDAGTVPKLAYHYLRRILAPVAVWTTDEGLAGVDVHVANDRPQPLEAQLRVALYRDHEHAVADASRSLRLEPHSTATLGVEAVLGRFVDAAWAYRFGPPGHDVIAVSLESADASSAGGLLGQAFRFVGAMPLLPEPAAALGLEVRVRPPEDGVAAVELRARRLVYCVRVAADGWRPSDDGFTIEPGGRRTIMLRRCSAPVRFEGVRVTALNLQGAVMAAPVEDA